jgi:hypothetical protein
MSIPLVVLILVLSSTFRGRANATMIAANARSRNANNRGRNFANQFLGVLKPFRLEILKAAVSLFRFQKYQKPKTGSNKSNQKNPGFTYSNDCMIILS